MPICFFLLFGCIHNLFVVAWLKSSMGNQWRLPMPQRLSPTVIKTIRRGTSLGVKMTGRRSRNRGNSNSRNKNRKDIE